MASSSLRCTLTPNPNGVVPRRHRAYFASTVGFSAFSNASKTNILSYFPFSTNYQTACATRFAPVRVSGASRISGSDNPTFDVVIVGAGIIGLTIARQFLLGSNLSVAVIDAAVPCAGATGAGQGYIWRVHKTPGSEKWDLAIRSHELWEDMAESVRNQGMDPLLELGWKKTGSMLVGQTAEECSVLRKKVEQLVDAGLVAEFLSSDDLMVKEPALKMGKESGAAFMPDDCQLDARRAVAFIEKANRYFATEGRYAEFFYEPVSGLLRICTFSHALAFNRQQIDINLIFSLIMIRSESTGEVEAVQTSNNTLYSKKAVIIAAGSWSGSLMQDLLKDSEIKLDVPIKPRKGHLLVLENFKSFQLNHGLMEVGYVNHESAALRSTADPGTKFHADAASISMTATMDMSGRVVFGSSRQLIGFDTEVDESIINRIWDRASEFFPVLKQVSLADLSKSREVRVGLRPYLAAGKPMIGPVPGLPKTFLAAGHEGEGLSLALGTAEMILNMVLENPQRVNPAPFSP